MLQQLFDLLGNAHFEAYIGGPIAGVLVGLLFAWFANRPDDNSNAQPPSVIYSHVVKHYHYERHYSHAGAHVQNSDNGGAAIGLGLLGLVLSFLFVAYLPQISFGLCFFIASISAFTISTCLLGVLSGQFNTFAWWRHTIFPFAISVICLHTVMLAERAIDIRIVEYAQGLLGSDHLTLSRILNGAIMFYKNLNNEYAKWIMHQMAAFSFSLFTAVAVFLQWLHYVALANSRTGVSRAWVKLAILTSRFSGLSTILIATIFSLLAWLFASGQVYVFLQG